MAQYFKDVFNIAPGLGRALDDPRVAEAQQQQALNLQAKAQRENVRQNLFANMLAQQQAMLQADQISSQGALENRRLNMQADQFQQQLSASSQEAAAQRAFQDAMLTRQLDASSRESALSRQFSGQQSALDRAMQQQNADRAFRSTQADQALRTQSYLDSRADRAQDVSFRNQSYADSRTDRAGDVAFRNQGYADSRSDRAGDVAFRNQGYLDSRSDRAGDVAFRNQSYADSRSDNAFQQLMAQQQFGLQQDQFGLQQQQFQAGLDAQAAAQDMALRQEIAPLTQEILSDRQGGWFPWSNDKGRLSEEMKKKIQQTIAVRPELAPVIGQVFQRMAPDLAAEIQKDFSSEYSLGTTKFGSNPNARNYYSDRELQSLVRRRDLSLQDLDYLRRLSVMPSAPGENYFYPLFQGPLPTAAQGNASPVLLDDPAMANFLQQTKKK